jgi:hypothetical protein
MVLLLLLVGCGGDGADEQAPVINVTQDPRVEGRWRITYTPDAGGEEQQATWKTRPICDAGPCTFSIISDAGASYSFEYEDSLKEWTGRDRQSMDCLADKGKKVLLKNAYVVRSEISLTPISVVKVGRESFVTEMTGERSDESSLSDEGFAKGCRDSPPTFGAIRAVRLDPPTGRPRPL